MIEVPPVTSAPSESSGVVRGARADMAPQDLVVGNTHPAAPPTETVSPPKAEESKMSPATTSAPVTPETGFSYAVVLGWDMVGTYIIHVA